MSCSSIKVRQDNINNPPFTLSSILLMIIPDMLRLYTVYKWQKKISVIFFWTNAVELSSEYIIYVVVKATALLVFRGKSLKVVRSFKAS